MSASFLAASTQRTADVAIAGAADVTDPALAGRRPTADALHADLVAGTLAPADYVKLAREAGVDTATVAAALKAVLVKAPAAPEPVAPPPSASTADVCDSASEGVDSSLRWLQTRPAAWGARAAERLGPANDFLFELELYDNCAIDDEGARHIAIALAANSTLTSVNLSSNRISDAGVQRLSQALHTARAVTALDLSSNLVGASGAAALVRLLSSAECSLQNLNVEGSDIPAEQRDALREAWGSRTGLRI
jgi:hypothetical protein